MMPERRILVDVAILGGGIVGLWTLARLRALGYSCVLLESTALGAGQSLASQGIIHGGIKYALGGAASRASRAIAEMPAIWNACLRGDGVLDLSRAVILADHQHLWTTGGLGARLMGLAASKVIRTGVHRVEPPARSDAFANAPRAVDLYRVDEPVLDVRSVLAALLHAAGGETFTIRCGVDAEGEGPIVRSSANSIDVVSGSFTGDDRLTTLGPVEVRASRYILAAGAGNEALLRRCGISVNNANPWAARMQRRPLHMVMLREADPRAGGRLPDLFGHAIGFSDKPRITVNTVRDAAGRKVWYVGGQLSEDGVARERDEQIAAARTTLHECLPWLDWNRGGLEWSTYRIDRAEGLTEDGSRPDEPVVFKVENMLVAWPTKLAFTPAVAERIRNHLEADGITPSHAAAPDVAALAGLPRPPMGDPPWDDRTGRITWTP